MALPFPLEACKREVVESALAAPWEGYGSHERYPALASKVAVLTIRLIKGHPCPDGNKRLGLILASAFLEAYGAELEASTDEIEHVFRLTAAAPEYDAALADLRHWFAATTRPLSEEG